jgi:hypothetical protein
MLRMESELQIRTEAAETDPVISARRVRTSDEGLQRHGV